ncbi:hypothetical protein PUMCH_003455 [Australozyma saopauloensis]|uniref:Superkiller protein 3 n=1 Tax=Australozyma saopauloensis TaxID=291208 RepID=A0AAX4HC56_9ASCO|nr:hypothetical protein PUMCH_003455 [[Candida] saopauloensis]
MSLKKQLKAAKAAIDQKDGAEALECIEQVLKTDPANYFGHLFKARAYQLLHNHTSAENAFLEAVQLEPDNLLGWRGYLQALKNGNSHEKFFQVVEQLAVRMNEQGELLELIPKEIYGYLHAHNFKSNLEVNEIFLRAILPGTPLGALLEGRMGPTHENVRKLLALVKAAEDLQVLNAVLKEKLRLPQQLTEQMRQQLAQLEWSYRGKSDLARLYELFISYCNDDDVRRQYEIEFLRYQHSMLRITPEKELLLVKVKEMAADLVLLDCTDIFPWLLHFDFRDDKLLADLDADLVLRFLRKFKGDPLGLVLYLYVMSEACTIDSSYFAELKTTQNTDPVDEDEPLDEPCEGLSLDLPEVTRYSQTEILELATQGFKGCTYSSLAHRIVVHINNFYSEYAVSLKVCADGIRKVASLLNVYGLDLANAREDLTCQLALVYTYYEAPKNFGRALQIFDKILQSNPQNEQALIGKGLILVEKGEYTKAESLLSGVVKEFPGNSQALNDLGWCLILQENYTQGRESLQKALTNVSGMSLRAFDLRASISWRMATSYLREDSNLESNVKLAYDLVLSSLSNSKFHAPSYTLLGTILHDHYGDVARAQKCFYKAFELDVAEITAARYLVTELCAKRDWDVVEILCERVVESEKSRKVLFSQLNTDPDRSWPYRVLGCSALNKQDDAKAIEWFQTALRMQAMDIECWTGLGEAYFNCGRIDAAIKVFQHTTELDGCTWVNYYMLGQGVCIIGDYPSGLELLEKALGLNPDAECIVSAIYEQSTLYSVQLLQGGFTGRAVEYNTRAIATIAKAVIKSKDSFNLWKVLGDCISLICKIQQKLADAPLETIFSILEHAESIDDSTVNLALARKHLENEQFIDCVSVLGVLTAKAALSKVQKRENRLIRSSVLFNLGLAYVNAFHVGQEKNTDFRDQAIVTLKDAIVIEPQNSQYWLTLGIAYVTLNPSLLQHCFIKASVLDSKDVTPWSNLAALYLRCGDAVLAQEAFDRATSVAPEQAVPWLGKALSADVLGDTETSTRLTTHAQVLSNGTDPLAQLCYAIVVVSNRILKSSDSRDVSAAQEVSIANAAIRRFLKFQPENLTGLKLAFLLSERCHTFEISIEVGELLCSALETSYEKTESSQTMIEVAVAKTQLARVMLGCGKYDEAVGYAQFTIDLLLDETSSEEIAKALLSSRIVIGLAFFFNGQYSEALEEFQVILEEHSQSHRAVTLIAQVLYAIDSPESKQAAVDHLFSFIEENGSSLLVVMALGAISLAENLDTYFEAIKEELEGLSLTDLMGDSRKAVPRLLEELNSVIGKKDSKVWQRFALLFPGDFKVWEKLNVQMGLSSSLLSEAKASAPEVSAAYIEKKTRREVQRSLLIYAGNQSARDILADVN